MAQVRALEAAETWDGAAWRGSLAASPVTDAWLALLAAGQAGEEEREPHDDYPVEWLEEDWLAAPDRVDSPEGLDESTAAPASYPRRSGISAVGAVLTDNTTGVQSNVNIYDTKRRTCHQRRGQF